MESSQVREEPFPAPSRQATGLIGGVETEAACVLFEDKIMVTLSQGGRLAQWVRIYAFEAVDHQRRTDVSQIQVPLSAPSPAAADMALPNNSLLPLTHLTPRTLLGGGGDERESSGQLYAVQIASHLARRNPEEQRTLLVGLGIAKTKPDRESFFDLIELVQKVL